MAAYKLQLFIKKYLLSWIDRNFAVTDKQSSLLSILVQMRDSTANCFKMMVH